MKIINQAVKQQRTVKMEAVARNRINSLRKGSEQKVASSPAGLLTSRLLIFRHFFFFCFLLGVD